jgi:hypothetical protein
MLTDPVTGELLDLDGGELLRRFTDSDAYKPLLPKYPRLRVSDPATIRLHGFDEQPSVSERYDQMTNGAC